MPWTCASWPSTAATATVPSWWGRRGSLPHVVGVAGGGPDHRRPDGLRRVLDHRQRGPPRSRRLAESGVFQGSGRHPGCPGWATTVRYRRHAAHASPERATDPAERYPRCKDSAAVRDAPSAPTGAGTRHTHHADACPGITDDHPAPSGGVQPNSGPASGTSTAPSLIGRGEPTGARVMLPRCAGWYARRRGSCREAVTRSTRAARLAGAVRHSPGQG
jgi:hypothetical protein